MAIYRDLNLFNPQQKPYVEDVEAIYQSLEILFNTKINEVLFRDVGSNLDDQLFEFIDQISSKVLYKIVVEAIKIYEPRVELDLARTEIIPREKEGAFEVNLYFKILGLEELSNQNFTFAGVISNNRG